MRRDKRFLAFALMTLAFGASHAALPPPTPEEAAAAKEKAQKESAMAEEQKKALEASQMRVAERWKRAHPQAAANAKPASNPEPIDKSDVPKAAREAPGEAGPHAGRDPSAESHSEVKKNK